MLPQSHNAAIVASTEGCCGKCYGISPYSKLLVLKSIWKKLSLEFSLNLMVFIKSSANLTRINKTGRFETGQHASCEVPRKSTPSPEIKIPIDYTKFAFEKTPFYFPLFLRYPCGFTALHSH